VFKLAILRASRETAYALQLSCFVVSFSCIAAKAKAKT
jgi:hypothetical protein